MTDQPTPHRLQTAIDSVAASAALVLKMKGPEQRSLWRRLLPGRGERRTRHRARRFIGALDQVLMSQASLLSAEQLDEIRRHVDAVIDRMEDEIRLNPPSSREGRPWRPSSTRLARDSRGS